MARLECIDANNTKARVVRDVCIDVAAPFLEEESNLRGLEWVG